MNKKWLAGPYLVWMVGFIVIPLLLIVYYGLTDKSGAFTLANVLSISTPEHVKALWLSLGLSLVSTVICLLLAYPLAMILRNRGIGQGSFIVFIFILPMWMNFLLRTLAWQTLLEKSRRYQRHLNCPAPAEPEPHQHPGSHHPGHGLQLPALHGASYL